jgi:Ca-activated chloride channel family protein
MKKNILTLIGAILFSFQFLIAQPEDKTESPYFFISTGNISLDEFPLLGTKASVTIVGSIADVTVTQSYSNNGTVPIEAVYVFPGSTRSAVYAMQMKVGDRIIKAKIKEQQQARAQYEKAKSEGRRASLLEQHKPNVFQMNVANILPGDVIEVEMSYTEFLLPESSVYSFVYPTVVGPRFADKSSEEGIPSFVNMPYTESGVKPKYTFDIELNISMGIPIKECISPSHNVNIEFLTAFQSKVTLDSRDNCRGTKDFIFNYRLTDSKIESGTILYEKGEDKYFLTMIEPPKNFSSNAIPAREYIFVVDVSGSMHGFPLNISKKLMRELLGGLRSHDVFNVVLFSAGSTVMSDRSVQVTKESIKKATKIIDSEHGSGGTQLLPALKKALSIANDPNRSSTVVIVTDGYVHVEEEAFELIGNNLDKVNVFSFGIGSSVNRHLIEGMAHVGQGEPFIITEGKYAHRIAGKFRKYIESPLLTNVSVKFNGFDAYDIIPSSIPDVMAERPVYLFGKYRGKPGGTITVEGKKGDGMHSQTVKIENSMSQANNSSLKYLWAREKIRLLSDFNAVRENEERKKEITALGLEYNLLTKYTSFLAEEKVAVVENGKKTYKVKQPLPLPEGVSNYAVGFEMGSEGRKHVAAVLSTKKVKVYFESHVKSTHKYLIKTLVNKFVESQDLKGSKLHLMIEISSRGVEITDKGGSLSISQRAKLISLIKAVIGDYKYGYGILLSIKSKS